MNVVSILVSVKQEWFDPGFEDGDGAQRISQLAISIDYWHRSRK